MCENHDHGRREVLKLLGALGVAGVAGTAAASGPTGALVPGKGWVPASGQA